MGFPYHYCPYCARELQPFSDGERLRLRCPGCGWVYYRNPTVGVACVLLRQPDSQGESLEILLGKRRDGGWCIPCGHVEWDESIEEAARREFLEETGLQIRLNGLLAVHSNFHNPGQQTVGVWYRCEVIAGELQPGGDLLEVAFYPLGKPPLLKFPTDRLVLQQLEDELKLYGPSSAPSGRT